MSIVHNSEQPRVRVRDGVVRDMRGLGEMRLRYMAQSKLTTPERGVAPLPSLEEDQRLLGDRDSSASLCKPQAALIERAAASIMALFFGSGTSNLAKPGSLPRDAT